MTKEFIGLNRDTRDKFYTSVDVAKHMISMFTKKVKVNSRDLFIEPSAGNGAFSNILFKKFKNVQAYDIEPQNVNINQQDFLEIVNPGCKNECKIHTIGNPPFGRQSTLAKRFIKKSAQFSSTIAFILPRSFKKPSFSQVFPPEFHLLYSEDCPDNAFVINGKTYNVPCVFQIWVRRQHKREIEYTEQPFGYCFCKQDDKPTFAI